VTRARRERTADIVLGRLAEPAGRFARFGLVGLSGLVVNESLLALLTERASVYYLASAVVSTQASILWNFALTESWVYRRRSCRLDLRGRLLAFCLVCTTAQLATTPFLYLLVDVIALPYLIGNLIAIPLATVLRFGLADRVIWRREPALSPAHPKGSA
jgi:dolichol-phosphate mannosyltransferase